MSNIPPKPKLREGYLFQSSISRKQELLEYFDALSKYHEARAERAIEALKEIDNHCDDQAHEIACKALADIAATDTGERG